MTTFYLRTVDMAEPGNVFCGIRPSMEKQVNLNRLFTPHVTKSSKMMPPPRRLELPGISFETASEPSTPTNSSLESLNIQLNGLNFTPTKSKLVVKQLSLASPSKSYSSTASACRICHEGDTLGPLISPCDCKGTIALVHGGCLEKWLTTANASQCEVCQYTFKVSQNPRPAYQWLTEQTFHTLYFDLLTFFFFVPGCVAVSIWGTRQALFYLKQGKWEGLGVFFITALLIICLSIWIYFTLRYHLRNFSTWRTLNMDTHLHSSRIRFNNRGRANHSPDNP